eukprot:TRINITY_DN13250_c0_g1_i1.p1 TRINITY_DN13250_c0_g1~~TRINITY_DN13250_c0_g1_i1.p1  ORF type:complete len:417 (-),score=93.40 TRINITY_DN13250_c0_g1_i1:1135-2385(-)
MESGVCYRGGIPAFEALPSGVKSKGVLTVSASAIRSRYVASISIVRSQGMVNFCGSRQFGEKVKCGTLRSPATFVTVASAESSKCDFRSVATPLEPQSSAGKFLSDILKNHPHIFHVAAAEQLEHLAADRDDAVARREQSLGSPESCLHRRIAEMKEGECQIAIEEVMYMLVVRKFSEIDVPMVPRLSKCINNGRLDIWTTKDRELESIHSLDVLELIREHLSTILGWRGKSDVTDNWTTTQICRLQLGRIYAASIMYGYFLKSACLRHRLELNLSLTHVDLPPGHEIEHPLAERRPCSLGNLAVAGCPNDTISSLYQGSGRDRRTEKLKRYLMGFDPETLQRCAKLKSQEAVNLIEKHSWALFGEDNESGSIDSDEAIAVTFSSLKRLVLEAVAFGSFLWDVERYVGSLYRLKMT